MNDVEKYRLTLHVHHPKLSASEIENKFSLTPRFSQSIGSPRKTKGGKLLGGVYKSTNVGFKIHDKPLVFDDFPLENLIKFQIQSYDLNFISSIVNSGGYCNFLLGIFAEENVSFELNAELITLLSKSNIYIKFDFYGGVEK